MGFFFFFYFFENEVKSIIRSSLSESEPLSESGVQDYGYDFYLENGCARFAFPRNSYVEIKEKLTPGILAEVVRRCVSLRDTFDKTIGQYILIYKDDPEGIAKNDGIIQKSGFKIRLLHFDYFSSLNNGKGITDIEEQYRDLQTQSLVKARKDFQTGRNTLFLGAGVSISASLPSWDALIKRISRKLNKDNKEALDYETIAKDSYHSSLVIARFLKQRITKASPNEYCNIVRDCLYSKRPTKSTLINSIRDSIQTGKVNQIITYNFDDLIERELEKKNIPFSSVISQNRPEKSSLPILHVHGFLPEGDTSFDNGIVFSEDEYHSMYRDAYHWTNIEQLHALTYTTCYFIGLSMSDPNLRRLLDISYERGPKGQLHYAFLYRKEYKDPIQVAEVLSTMGVDVIWYNSYDELPTIIDYIIQ